MYTVYVLKSLEYNKSYVGFTDNIIRRLKEHNAGYNNFSKRYKPWIIIYTEFYQTRSVAHQKEKYFKSSAGRRWMKKNINFNADVAELVYAQS